MPFITVNKMLAEAGDAGHVSEPVSVSDPGERGRNTLLNRRRCSPAPPASRLCSAVVRSSWSIFGCCLEYFCLWHGRSGVLHGAKDSDNAKQQAGETSSCPVTWTKVDMRLLVYDYYPKQRNKIVLTDSILIGIDAIFFHVDVLTVCTFTGIDTIHWRS